MLLSATIAWAVPALPGKKKSVVTYDGKSIQVTLHGDENFNYWLDSEGNGYSVSLSNLATRLTAAQMEAGRSYAKQTYFSSQKRRAARRKSIGQFQPLTGKKKGLVILMQYADVKFVTPQPSQAFNDLFNKKNYYENGVTGSVYDYFFAQSYGKFELDFDVVGPYTAQHNMAYYGGNNDEGRDNNPRALIKEAIDQADAEVNFADYDWDGNGEVDQIFVIYAGYGPNFGSNPDNIWPHESTLWEEPVYRDGKLLYTYACSCELYGVSGNQIDGIGTACHEFSHCLGYPDLYDTSGSDKLLGPMQWDVMCNGSYNNRSRTPSGYTSYERWMAGWLEPVEVTSEMKVSDMKALVDAPEAYVLYNERNRNEFYLLENRQQKGFDAAIDGHGLVVLHVDYDKNVWDNNSVNSGDYDRVTIIPADGLKSEGTLSGDPFPGTSGVTALTDYTTPAAKLNNFNTGNSKLMHKPIECITEKDGLISMWLCAPTLTAPEYSQAVWSEDNTSVDVSWNPVTRAKQYELILTGNPKKAGAEEAKFVSEDFSGCISNSIGFSDIGKKLDNYFKTTGWSGTSLYTSPDGLRVGTSSKAGVLQSPVFNGCTTGDVTFVLNVKPIKADTKVTGIIKVATNSADTRHDIPFEFKSETTLVLHTSAKLYDVFRLYIQPEAGMTLSGMYLYDGNFSEAELGLPAPQARAPHRSNTKQTVTTTDAHYVFTDLNPNYDYLLQMRAHEDGRTSLWSDEILISNHYSAIQDVQVSKLPTVTGVFTLGGQRVIGTPKPGLYIKNGKKVIIK